MKIDKYRKLKNGKYELTLEDKTKLDLYEDVILKFNLLLTKNIEKKEKKKILEFDQECEVYYVALKTLKRRAKSKNEMKDDLIKKEYPQDFVDKAISKLESQGYINDLVYAKSFVNNKLITSSSGPYKIKQEMLKVKIPESVIEEALLEYTEEIQIEKINKLITRAINSNRNKGNSLLKRKIISDLTIQGFKKELITAQMNNHEFKDDSDIAKKEYEKLYKKLSSKYEGAELEFKIKQKLYQKGLTYEK